MLDRLIHRYVCQCILLERVVAGKTFCSFPRLSRHRFWQLLQHWQFQPQPLDRQTALSRLTYEGGPQDDAYYPRTIRVDQSSEFIFNGPTFLGRIKVRRSSISNL